MHFPCKRTTHTGCTLRPAGRFTFAKKKKKKKSHTLGCLDLSQQTGTILPLAHGILNAVQLGGMEKKKKRARSRTGIFLRDLKINKQASICLLVRKSSTGAKYSGNTLLMLEVAAAEHIFEPLHLL